MKEFLRKKRWPVLLGIAGALGGFLYWRFVGCTTGSCPIKSVWYWSTLWGMILGYLAGDILQDLIRKRKSGHEGKI